MVDGSLRYVMLVLEILFRLLSIFLFGKFRFKCFVFLYGIRLYFLLNWLYDDGLLGLGYNIDMGFVMGDIGLNGYDVDDEVFFLCVVYKGDKVMI